MKTVCVVGLGYIGLPTAIVAAQSDLCVVGVDIDADRVEKINQGVVVIEEPEIAEQLKLVINTRFFHATTRCKKADYFIICVPTPFTEDKRADLSYVFAVVDQIAPLLEKGNVVILESTVPVGTTQKIAIYLQEKSGLRTGVDFYVAYCPERVLPGNIFHELKVNDRVIGGVNRASIEHAASFYKYFVSGDLYLTSATEAEMVKLVENSYRDVNIAFAHQVAAMAESLCLDPYEIIDLANNHPRVKILKPTCGVGGHCIAVDPWFLVETFPEQTQLLTAARNINDERPFMIVKYIYKAVQRLKKNGISSPKVLLLGLTYKPDIDDIRESPAFTIAKVLNEANVVELRIVDEHVQQKHLDESLHNRMIDYKKGIEWADLVVALVAHSTFKSIDLTLLSSKKILDFCGLFHVNRPCVRGQEQFFWPAMELRGDVCEASVCVIQNSAEHAEKEYL